MKELEKQRLALFDNEDDKKQGLIIPIVFRSWESLPAEIKDYRSCHNFDGFLLCDRKMEKHYQYAPKIKEIADYIARRCEAFNNLTSDPFMGCGDFSLPNEETIMPWLESIKGRPIPFPWG